ncbi:hypothetical protein Hanom_Chr12g01065101 [Helianthus anomalus]
MNNIVVNIKKVKVSVCGFHIAIFCGFKMLVSRVNWQIRECVYVGDCETVNSIWWLRRLLGIYMDIDIDIYT